MADYKVGNLQIKFSALNKINFKTLKNGLNGIRDAIISITNIDSGKLDIFSSVLSNLSTKFLPFLSGVEKASGGLALFNDTLRQVGTRGGARGISSVVSALQNIKNGAQDTSNTLEDTNKAIVEGITEEQRKIALQEEQRRIISELKAQYESLAQSQKTKPEVLEQISQTKAQIQNLTETVNFYKESLRRAFEDTASNATTQEQLTQNFERYRDVIANLQLYIEETQGSIASYQQRLAQLQAQFGAPFKEAQSAASALKNELLNIHYATGEISQDDVAKWHELTSSINNTERAVNRALMSEEELAIADQKEALAKNDLQIAYLKAQMGLGRLNMTQEEYRAELQRIEEEQRRLRGEIEETSEEQEDADKKTKKHTSSWKKFLGQVKRIAIYRLIRTALRGIVSAIRDTINAFAQVDDNVNDTMSQLTTSLQFIKLGFGSSLLPLLQMIAPIVEQIGYAFADLGNIISASMSKDGKFTKINTEAWKDYREQVEKTNSALLDFDKFRVLNTQQGSLSDFLLPNQSVEEFKEELGFAQFGAKGLSAAIEGVSKVISKIFETIEKIGQSVVFKTIVGVIGHIVYGLGQVVGFILDILNKSGLIEPILITILSYLVLIKLETLNGLGNAIKVAGTKFIAFFQNIQLQGALATTTLQKMRVGFQYLGVAILSAFASFALFNSIINAFEGEGKKVVSIISIVVGSLTALLGVILAIKGGLKGGLAGAIIAGVGAGAVLAGIMGLSNKAASDISNISLHANGGLPGKGTMFIAGEAGAEMVYNMPSGQSGVANVTQIEQAFYNALVRYGRENNGGAINVNVNLDGQQLYRSVERAAGQRGLGFARK